MIESKHIQVQEVETPNDGLALLASLHIRHGVPVEKDDKSQHEATSDTLRRSLYHHIYGDLISPIEELKHFALLSNPENQSRVRELIEKIDELLRFK